MDFNLLRSWLSLPSGSWPPDHYTLLGLAPGQYDAARIESLVLERMDRLRGHQLLHPEVVTEGMNRLAQALITLTDPQGKAAYDRELRISSGPVEPLKSPAAVPSPKTTAEESVVVAEPVFDDDIFSDDARAPGPTDLSDATRIIEWNPDVALPETPARGTAEFELPADAFAAAPPSPSFFEVVPDARETADRIGVPSPELAPPGLDTTALASRRHLYARLARLRKARQAWQRLGPILGNPDDPVDRPVRLLILLEAVGAVRPLLSGLRGVIGGIGEPGGMIAAVVRQPLVLDTFRRLLPSQRTSLAIDWKQAERQLEQEYARLRQIVHRNRERRAGARSGLVFLRWISASPEVLLVVLVGVLLFLALIRAATGR